MGTFQMWLLNARKGSLYQVRNISDISTNLYIPILLGYWQPLTESCTTHARKNESLSSFVYSILHILTRKMMYHNKDQTQKRKESHQEYIIYKDIYIYIYINDSKEVLYLWKCKVCGVVPYVGKAKIKFCYRFDHYKSKHRAFRKDNRQVPQKLFHTYYCLDDHSGIEDWDFVIFEKCETYAQLKERETFW